MPARHRLPDDPCLETYELLYDKYNWSVQDIQDHTEADYRDIRNTLSEAGYDLEERHQGPVRGPGRKLWEMEPDDLKA